MSKSKKERSGYDKFNTESSQESESEGKTNDIHAEGKQGTTVADAPDNTPDGVDAPGVPDEARISPPPGRDTRSAGIQTAAAYATGREIPGLKVKGTAHPLLVECHDLLQKFLAAHIIAPFAMLAQMEAEALLDKLRKEIEDV